jgi:hypothetical protein
MIANGAGNSNMSWNNGGRGNQRFGKRCGGDSVLGIEDMQLFIPDPFMALL